MHGRLKAILISRNDEMHLHDLHVKIHIAAFFMQFSTPSGIEGFASRGYYRQSDLAVGGAIRDNKDGGASTCVSF